MADSATPAHYETFDKSTLKDKKVVYVDMVADLFHPGHLNFIRQCRTLGNFLIVGLTSDEDVMAYKRRPVLTTHQRWEMVSHCRLVDLAIPAPPTPVTAEFLDEWHIDVVGHGDDFSEASMNKWYAVPAKRGIMKTVPYTQGVSTSELLARAAERHAAGRKKDI